MDIEINGRVMSAFMYTKQWNKKKIQKHNKSDRMEWTMINGCEGQTAIHNLLISK